jgi:hypothetical protein
MACTNKATKNPNLVFSSIILPSKMSEINAMLLMHSIRSFAGSLSQNPLWCFFPEGDDKISQSCMESLDELGVKLIPFEIEKQDLEFPFVSLAYSAAKAESIAQGSIEIIAWLNPNTVVLNEPIDFILSKDKSLGFRPVHHTLIGSRYNEQLDSFWSLIYRYCDVPNERVFPMMTHVDNTLIRPYFNAGILVARPEKNLLRKWRDTYLKIYRKPPFQKFYQMDKRYKIFIHQAVLSGVILSTLTTSEIHELPSTYNYPIHLYEEDMTEHRPTRLEELITFRHEGFYKDPRWIEKIPAQEPLKHWLIEQTSY